MNEPNPKHGAWNTRRNKSLCRPNRRAENKPSELSEFMTALAMAILAVALIGFAGWMDWL